MSKASSKVGKAMDWEKLNRVVRRRGSRSCRRCVELTMTSPGLSRRGSFQKELNAEIRTWWNEGLKRPQSFNWDFYKEKLGLNIANLFEKSVNSLDKEVPDYECEFTEDYRAKHQSLMALAKEKEVDSKRKIIAIDNELVRIREEKEGLATITVDEYYSKHPAVGTKIDDEIRSHNWG